MSGELNTHCPECGKPYDPKYGPQPKSHVCGDCLFGLSMAALLGSDNPKPMVIIRGKSETKTKKQG